MDRVNERSRVLIVEDDPTFGSFWVRLFMELGVTNYTLLSDPVVAMRLLEHEDFDLLISDVIMPRMNGYELAKFASRHNPKMTILLTTGYRIDLSHFDLEGCRFHILRKPYENISEIKKLIIHLLNGEDVFEDASDDSVSENEDYPLVTEWKL
jgi:DNA-binding NtrC family response regulator